MSFFNRDLHFQHVKKYHIVSSVNESVLTNRFGTRSHNMFFVRHAANPRNLKFVTGVDGSMICSVKEDSYTLPDDMKKILKNTLYESPAYDKFFFPKLLNDSIPEKEEKRNQTVKNLIRKIGIANPEIKSDIDKLSLLNKFVNEPGKKIIQKQEERNSKRNIKNSKDRLKNSEKYESRSVFWMEPTKAEKNLENLKSNSLILPKLKTLRLRNLDEKEKNKIDKIIINDLKIRNVDSLSQNGTMSTSINSTFSKT